MHRYLRLTEDNVLNTVQIHEGDSYVGELMLTDAEFGDDQVIFEALTQGGFLKAEFGTEVVFNRRNSTIDVVDVESGIAVYTITKVV